MDGAVSWLHKIQHDKAASDVVGKHTVCIALYILQEAVRIERDCCGRCDKMAA